MRWIDRFAILLVVVGALNWGLVGLFEYDLIAEIVGEKFGETNAVSRIIYTLVGLAGLVMVATRLQTASDRPEPQRVCAV